LRLPDRSAIVRYAHELVRYTHVRTLAPPLLPLFRSDAQARLLAQLYLRPERRRTLSELARELGVSHTTLSREADRLEQSGLVESEYLGKQRLLSRNERSVYFHSLRDLLLRAFGPLPLLERALPQQTGVTQAFLYGSWAARYLGEPGEAPHDLDLLVVGTPQRNAIARLSRDLERELGIEVNPTIVSVDDWKHKRTGFLRSLADSPLVEIGLGNDGRS